MCGDHIRDGALLHDGDRVHDDLHYEVDCVRADCGVRHFLHARHRDVNHRANVMMMMKDDSSPLLWPYCWEAFGCEWRHYSHESDFVAQVWFAAYVESTDSDVPTWLVVLTCYLLKELPAACVVKIGFVSQELPIAYARLYHLFDEPMKQLSIECYPHDLPM